MQKNFLNYINVFRGLAILLIVMGHSMQFGTAYGLSHHINREIVCGGTALFIFISGFLFQHLSSKFEYKTYLSKKWTNVIMPYLITSIPGILFCFFLPHLYRNSFEGLNVFIQIPVLLSLGRVHNSPTWFIPMIVLFFICSIFLLKLEKKGILYKTLPILFLITIFLPRGDIEYENLIGLSYGAKYLAYVKYILVGFIHFFSLYVFGMYCSKNKNIIDKFYNLRFIIFLAMVITSIADIYLSFNNIYCNFTISKTFLTMLLLCYLKHYDEFILSRKKINQVLDIIAKYSFGIFFIHWYWIFAYNQILHLKGVMPIINGNYIEVIILISIRFIIVTILSILTLFLFKKILLKINKNINTRMFFGV